MNLERDTTLAKTTRPAKTAALGWREPSDRPEAQPTYDRRYEALPETAREDILLRAFQLALLLVGDRSAAIDILIHAKEKHRAQCFREVKRSYWRDKFLKTRITKIARDSLDTLQWLIYHEAERYETLQEQNGDVTENDLIVRYIKKLVQTTTAMNSFYVNIGLNRILHRYSTREVQRVYEWLTARFLESDEYRRARLVIFKVLYARFRPFVQPSPSKNRELEFEAATDQERSAELVDSCLRAFTPWSTQAFCANPRDAVQVKQALRGQQLLNQDTAEASRFHILLHPPCRRDFLKELKLPPPQETLRLPQFHLSTDFDGRTRSRAGAPLGAGEREQIEWAGNAQTPVPDLSKCEAIRVVVDGTERARDSFDGRLNLRFAAEEGAKLIEVRADYRGQDLLLGVHWIEYQRVSGVRPTTAMLNLGKGITFVLTIAQSHAADAKDRPITIALSARPTERSAARLTWLMRPLPAYSFVLLAVAALVSVAGFLHYRQSGQPNTRLSATRTVPSPLGSSATQPPRTPSYSLTPDDLVVRGTESLSTPTVTISAQQTVVNLELPVDAPTGSFTASLRAYRDHRPLLTENALTSAGDGRVVVFPVPTTLLAEGVYTVELRRIDARGKTLSIHTFSFPVVRK